MVFRLPQTASVMCMRVACAHTCSHGEFKEEKRFCIN